MADRTDRHAERADEERADEERADVEQALLVLVGTAILDRVPRGPEKDEGYFNHRPFLSKIEMRHTSEN